MGLLRLPNELILDISEWLDLHNVNRRLQTCYRFASLLHKHLYRRDVRDNNASSLRWACYHSEVSGHDCCYHTASHAVAAGANVNMVWRSPDRTAQRTFVRIRGIRVEGMSPMLLAACKDDVQMAQLLVESKADINLDPADGFSPIIAAVDCDSTGMIKYLLERKVDLHVSNGCGYGVLAIAAGFQDMKTVALLLSHIDDPDETGHSRITAVCNAAAENKMGNLAVLLESDNLDLNRICNVSGSHTALTQACAKGSLGCVQLLCEDERTKIDEVNGLGYSPVDAAISFRQWDIALYLIRSERLHQGQWGTYFAKLCRDGRPEALEVAEEMIRQSEMTESFAIHCKKSAQKCGHYMLVDIINAKAGGMDVEAVKATGRGLLKWRGEWSGRR